MSEARLPEPARIACCTGCGMRYPSPVGDPRAGTCPRCEAPTVDLGAYDPAYPAPPSETLRLKVELRGVLDNVRSALNVGTMLRAADGARVGHMHLCGLTPAGDHPKVAKTALDAEHHVGWTHHLDATRCVADLIADGFTVWAVEATPGSDGLADAVRQVAGEVGGRAGEPWRLALIVGSETAGVDPGLLRLAHRHVHLPMDGAKTTLNVGVAFGAVRLHLRSMLP